jgi:hypothetical protein
MHLKFLPESSLVYFKLTFAPFKYIYFIELVRHTNLQSYEQGNNSYSCMTRSFLSCLAPNYSLSLETIIECLFFASSGFCAARGRAQLSLMELTPSMPQPHPNHPRHTPSTPHTVQLHYPSWISKKWSPGSSFHTQ